MGIVSNGRPERKDVTEQIERWKKESAEKLKRQQQERKRKETPVAEVVSAV